MEIRHLIGEADNRSPPYTVSRDLSGLRHRGRQHQVWLKWCKSQLVAGEWNTVFCNKTDSEGATLDARRTRPNRSHITLETSKKL